MNYNQNNPYNYNNPNVIPMALNQPVANQQYNPYNTNNQPNAYTIQQQQQYYLQQQQQQKQQQQQQFMQGTNNNNANNNNLWGGQQQQQQYQQQFNNNNNNVINKNPNIGVQGSAGNNPVQNNQPNNNLVQNIEHSKALEQMRSKYAFQVQPAVLPSDVGKKTIVNVDLELPNMKIPVRIELLSDFPTSKPLIFLRKRILQQNVKDSTLRVVYDSFFRWEKTSTLVNLITQVHLTFQQCPPQPDFLAEKIKEIKEKINDKEESQKFLSIDAKSVFEGYQAQDFQVLLQQSDLKSHLDGLPQIDQLEKKIGEIAEFNVKMSSDLLEQQQQLEKKKQALQELSQQYEIQKSELFTQVQASNSIKERFSSMSILQALQQKIEEIEADTTSQIKGNFEEDIKNFKAGRLQYNILTKKRDKLLRSN